MKNPLKILIEPRLPGIIIPLLIGASLWFFPDNTNYNESLWSSHNTSLSGWLNVYIEPYLGLRNFLGFIYTLILSFLLLQLSQQFTLIRNRSFLPFFFFVVLMGCNIHVHLFDFTFLGALFILIAIWQLFSVYEKRTPIAEAFNIGLLVGFGSLFAIELLLFFPLLFFGIQKLKGFSFRSLLALNFGLITPFILIIGVLFVIKGAVYPYITLFLSQFEFDVYLHIDFLSIGYLVMLLLFGIIAVLNILNNPFSDKIKVSKMMGLLSFGLFFSALSFIIKTDNSRIIFIIGSLFSSLLFAHFYTLSGSLFSRILFGIQILACIIFYIASQFITL